MKFIRQTILEIIEEKVRKSIANENEVRITRVELNHKEWAAFLEEQRKEGRVIDKETTSVDFLVKSFQGRQPTVGEEWAADDVKYQQVTISRGSSHDNF